MRLLTVFAVLTATVVGTSPALSADASVPSPDGSTLSDAAITVAPDAHIEAGRPPADASRPSSDASRPGKDASSTGDAGAIPPTLTIGGTCKKASDCAAGLTCLLPTSTELGGGGPASGLCTFDCSQNGQADCDSVDTGSLCFKSGAVGYCFQRCTPGDTSDAPKCRTRADMACTPADTGEGYCKPTCRGDFDCGSRTCDPVTGLCKDAAQVVGSLPIGSECDSTAAKTNCFGTCVATGSPATTANSMCTAACSLGMPGGCGNDPASTAGRATAACLLPPFAGEGTGDIGACVQLCDCDSDCLNHSFVCQVVQLSQGVGRAGACVRGDSVDALGQPVQHLTCRSGVGSGGQPSVGAGGKSSAGGSGATSASGGAAAAPASSGSDSGCGCHVGGSRESDQDRGALASILAAVGLVLAGRRRATRR